MARFLRRPSLPHKLSARLAAAYLAVVLLVVLLLSVAVLYFSRYYLYNRMTEDLDGQASFYAVFAGEVAPDDSSYRSLAPSLAGKLDLPSDTVVRFFSSSGTLLGASKDIGPAPSSAVVSQLRTVLFVPVPRDQNGRLYRAKPVLIGNQVVGIAEVSRATSDLEGFLATLRNVMVVGGLGAAVLALVLSTVMANWVSRPIQELENLARAIGGNDFDRRITWHRRDELGSLAGELNNMAGKLALTIETLSAQKARLTAVLNNLRDGVVALDSEGRVVLFNAAAQALGLDRLDLRELADRLPNLEGLIEEDWRDAGRHIGLTLAPIVEDSGRRTGTLIVMRDVTRLHQMEQMRQRFISNVSHELRTPLTSIKGFLANLIDDAGPSQQRGLTVIDEETDRLLRLVNELLELSRLQSGDLAIERRPVDVMAIAQKAMVLVAERAQRLGISLETSTPVLLPPAFADPDRLQQVMVNLLDNALKFTPAGGTVVLEVGPAQGGMIDGQMDGRDGGAGQTGLLIAVSDSGPGLTADELAHAFDRFFQTKGAKRAKGAGLGLTIAKEIVEAHGGQITIANRPVGGARVTVILPLVPAGSGAR